MSADERNLAGSDPRPTPPPGARHLGLALAVIAAAQFMVVLDGTIMNVALPSVQTALDMSAAGLAWVINAYALAFGGLLLLGGRLGDLVGRVLVFRAGITVFALASLLGGLAPNEAVLVVARALQGVGAAIAAPTALSLIATTFPGPERGRAMGVYGSMAGLGSTAGILLGGVLTSYLNWRWVLFVNVPIAAVVLLGSRYLVPGERATGRLDIPGAITGTAGATALVYAITRGGEAEWSDRLTIASFAASAVLIAVFLVIQTRSANPMLPLGVLRDRNRAGANLSMLLIGVGMFATYYFLTLYMQQILGYSAIQAALAYLPWAAGILLSSGVLAPRLLTRVSPATITGVGLLVAAAGMFWLSTFTPTSNYLTELAPAMIVTSLGLGATFVPMTICAIAGVGDRDSGVAAGVLNTGQQIGGAIGLATLTGVAATAAASLLPSASEAYFLGLETGDRDLLAHAREALTEGHTTAFACVVAVYLAAMVVTVLVVRGGRTPAPRP